MLGTGGTPFGADPIQPFPTRILVPEPLTDELFAPFGQVVARPASAGHAANDGTARRWDGLAPLVLTAAGGRPLLSWMRVAPVRLPLTIRKLERHPRSSQLFMPLDGRPFLVVVAPGGDAPGEDVPDVGGLRAFRTSGSQGVNFAPGTWHHAALALDVDTDFLVLGHASDLPDCDVHELSGDGAVVRA